MLLSRTEANTTSTVGIVLTSPTRRATEVAAVCTWHWAQRPNAICLGWSLAFSHALYIEAMIPSIRLQNAAPEPERILQQRSSSLTRIVYSAPFFIRMDCFPFFILQVLPVSAQRKTPFLAQAPLHMSEMFRGVPFL